MTSRAAAMAYAAAIAAIATTTLAATINDGRLHEKHPAGPSETSVGITWVPDWLREPLSRALKDANDPRDRKR